MLTYVHYVDKNQKECHQLLLLDLWEKLTPKHFLIIKMLLESSSENLFLKIYP